MYIERWKVLSKLIQIRPEIRNICTLITHTNDPYIAASCVVHFGHAKLRFVIPFSQRSAHKSLQLRTHIYIYVLHQVYDICVYICIISGIRYVCCFHSSVEITVKTKRKPTTLSLFGHVTSPHFHMCVYIYVSCIMVTLHSRFNNMNRLLLLSRARDHVFLYLSPTNEEN